MVERMRMAGIGRSSIIAVRCVTRLSIAALHFLQHKLAKKLFDGDRTGSL
ncbi:hypothetical protein [Xanthomonas bromi]|nr:hypothetical protein [Xanthomonas bromi]